MTSSRVGPVSDSNTIGRSAILLWNAATGDGSAIKGKRDWYFGQKYSRGLIETRQNTRVLAELIIHKLDRAVSPGETAQVSSGEDGRILRMGWRSLPSDGEVRRGKLK